MKFEMWEISKKRIDFGEDTAQEAIKIYSFVLMYDETKAAIK
jgi:hypothetical protein